MTKLTLPKTESPAATVSESFYDLTKMSVEELYNYQNTVNEHTEKDLYWRINREIQKRKVKLDMDAMEEAQNLRSALNLFKLAIEELISEIKTLNFHLSKEGS